MNPQTIMQTSHQYHTNKTTCAYREFIQRKSKSDKNRGFDVDEKQISDVLFPFQRQIVKWGLKKAKCAFFVSTGLGKTVLQVEFARLALSHLRSSSEQPFKALIIAPLGVARQTVIEAKRLLNVDIIWCRSMQDVQLDSGSGIYITNYESLHKFDRSAFQITVLDESSIIKGLDSKIRKLVGEFSEGHLFKLACSATPAPNDNMELLNHAEWLDIMTVKEAIALFFIQKGNSSHNYRLKNHAVNEFWRWVASWAIAVEMPSDIDSSFDDTGYILPPLIVKEKIIQSPDRIQEGYLFSQQAVTLTQQRKLRRETLSDRVNLAKQIIDESTALSPNRSILIWCEYNTESEALVKAIPDSKEVTGSQSPEIKESVLNAFSSGEVKILITKPTIAGFGLNWQHCDLMIFLGVSHSMEQTYQAIRRCWRYGQTNPVKVYFIRSELDGLIASNLASKEQEYRKMMRALVERISFNTTTDNPNTETETKDDYDPKIGMIVPSWLKAKHE